ncbi:MAG: tryptophan synthase, alpha subunit [Deltaproteobacteria bacterium]|nr:tryptophan synthase, alpha subunit [Deltaproteobacteria bacterium]
MGKIGIYLLANYPSREAFIEAVRICDKENIDFLEIGFPFSDPIADGDVLEKACYDTLQRYNFDDTINSLHDAQRIFRGKIYIMTYTNVVYGPGIENFIMRLGNISGIILADLPLREVKPFEKLFNKHGIPVIRFLTPESRDEDIDNAVKSARDFIYFVSKRGTTGGEFTLGEETQAKISRAKGKGGVVFLGFGIKDRKDIELAFQYADGAIIGTKAISELEQGTDIFRSYIGRLKKEDYPGGAKPPGTLSPSCERS